MESTWPKIVYIRPSGFCHLSNIIRLAQRIESPRFCFLNRKLSQKCCPNSAAKVPGTSATVATQQARLSPRQQRKPTTEFESQTFRGAVLHPFKNATTGSFLKRGALYFLSSRSTVK